MAAATPRPTSSRLGRTWAAPSGTACGRMRQRLPSRRGLRCYCFPSGSETLLGHSDPQRTSASRWKGEFPPVAVAGDPPHLIATELSEPERPIRPCRDPLRVTVSKTSGEVAHLAAGGDPPNLTALVLGEPE